MAGGGAAGSAAGSGAAGQAGKTGILSAINPQGAVDAGKAFQATQQVLKDPVLASQASNITGFKDVLKASAL